MSVSREGGVLSITWGWSRTLGWIMLLAGFIFVTAGYFVANEPLQTGELRTPGEVAAMTMVFGCIGLLTSYFGLALALDRTAIKATAREIVCRTFPLPMLRRRTYSITGLKQFFVRMSGHDSASLTGRALYLVDADDHARLITSNLPNSFAAHQACHELQDFYGLEDIPVYGETTHPHHPGPRS